ncbi:MAG: cell division protein FtsH, partial [Desulfobacterales bacterium]|nr:cell division protein FtsH [Desulfobacterales bacterium]
TALANRMVRIFGMSENLVPMSYEVSNDNIFIGREMGQAKEYSEETAKKIDKEVSSLITRSYKVAQDILKDNIEILHTLSELLIEKETVMGKELDELVKSMKPDFVFPKRDEELEKELQSDSKQETKESESSEQEIKESEVDESDDIKLDIDEEGTDDKS